MFVRSVLNLFRSVGRAELCPKELKRFLCVKAPICWTPTTIKEQYLHLFRCRNDSSSLRYRNYCTSALQDKVPYYISAEDFEVLSKGDPNLKKKLQVLQLEIEVWRQEGIKVPQNLTTIQWHEVLHYDTRTRRRKYLKFLWLNEVKRENDKKKKEENRKKLEEYKERRGSLSENVASDQLEYGLCRNTIFLRMYDTTVNAFYNNNLVRAMQFGQPLVVDCGYDAEMTPRECINCASQLQLLFAENRQHADPFNLHLCNADTTGLTMQKLCNFIPTIYDKHFPLNVTEKSYLDMFPKSKLVYLTPHCNEELRSFDHDAVYIIGGMVDKVNVKHFSLAKAKREGLQMAKFPLDRYLFWGDGNKSLTLNQVIQILLEVRTSGNWEKALSEHVPKRKIRDPKLVVETVMRRKAKEMMKLDKRDRRWNEQQSYSKNFSRY